MANKAAGEVRAPQLVGMFGPGSIVNLESLSVMPCTPERWTHGALISSPTFARQIGASMLLDAASMSSGIDSVIFPSVFVCRTCGTLEKRTGATQNELRDGLCCARDRGRLYPSRWVVYCRSGHIDDFDYRRFVHDGKKCDAAVRLDTGASIADSYVRCECGASRNMREAYAWVKRHPCSGRQPWISEFTKSDCTDEPKLSMRSSSDIYFSAVRSAITIEPESKPLVRALIGALAGTIPAVRESVDEALKYLRNQTFFASVPESELIAAYKEYRMAADSPEEYRDRRRQEFNALSTPCGGRNEDLWVEEVFNHDLERFAIARLLAVRKLREVRAIVGFQRGAVPIDPTFEHADIELPIQQFGPLDARRFPAYENRGEGIFVVFDTVRLREWLTRPAVEARSEIFKKAEESWRESTARAGEAQRRAVFIVAHSFAHLLIRQLALVSGYSQASLRERIFVSPDDAAEPWAGVLVYTSSSDADGSLGGLVAQALGKKLPSILQQGLHTISVCSSDPVCALQTPVGFRKLNGAACHSCIVLPETCCERNNAFLDRNLIVPGTVHMDTAELCLLD